MPVHSKYLDACSEGALFQQDPLLQHNAVRVINITITLPFRLPDLIRAKRWKCIAARTKKNTKTGRNYYDRQKFSWEHLERLG